MREAKPPSLETLGRLAQMLPNLAEGAVNGRITGLGKGIVRLPRFHCPACERLYGQRGAQGAIPDDILCRKCRKFLEDGYTLFKCKETKEMVAVKPSAESGVAVADKYRNKIVVVPQAFFEQFSKIPQ